MKSFARCVSVVASVFLFASGYPAAAGSNLYWDNKSANGNWDKTTTNWHQAANPPGADIFTDYDVGVGRCFVFDDVAGAVTPGGCFHDSTW